MAIEIVDLPIDSMVIFHRFLLRLPGTTGKPDQISWEIPWFLRFSQQNQSIDPVVAGRLSGVVALVSGYLPRVIVGLTINYRGFTHEL
jgi:hypothetical protein